MFRFVCIVLACRYDKSRVGCWRGSAVTRWSPST